MGDVVIQAERLGKQYRIRSHRNLYGSLSENIAHALSLPFGKARTRRLTHSPGVPETIWALQDITFEVNRGEVLGIIGRNGSGKSTLLKVLSRITEPTVGQVLVNGRVGSLLEVGTGFHPELTGRENIYLNGAILGMKKVDIDHRLDEIVAFSEVEKFVDTPVKHYSSGMYMRLAFAVAAHLEPQILLVDEVLAVGDAAFQRKCLGKMDHIAKEGRTVLFVSHNLQAVGIMCERAILLEKGNMVADGHTGEVIRDYIARQREGLEDGLADLQFPVDEAKSGEIRRIRITNGDKQPTLRHNLLRAIGIDIEFLLRRDFYTLTLNVQVWSQDSTLVFATMDSDWRNYTNEQMCDRFPRKSGYYKASLEIPSPLLNVGLYELEVVLTPGPTRVDTQRGIYLEIEDDGSFISYVSKSNRGGVLAVPIKWNVEWLGS